VLALSNVGETHPVGLAVDADQVGVIAEQCQQVVRPERFLDGALEFRPRLPAELGDIRDLDPVLRSVGLRRRRRGTDVGRARAYTTRDLTSD
jgi:hypothetical protein